MTCAETKGTITPGRGQEDPNSGKFGSFFKAGGENGTTQADMVRGLVWQLSAEASATHSTGPAPPLQIDLRQCSSYRSCCPVRLK